MGKTRSESYSYKKPGHFGSPSKTVTITKTTRK